MTVDEENIQTYRRLLLKSLSEDYLKWHRSFSATEGGYLRNHHSPQYGSRKIQFYAVPDGIIRSMVEVWVNGSKRFVLAFWPFSLTWRMLIRMMRATARRDAKDFNDTIRLENTEVHDEAR